MGFLVIDLWPVIFWRWFVQKKTFLVDQRVFSSTYRCIKSLSWFATLRNLSTVEVLHFICFWSSQTWLFFTSLPRAGCSRCLCRCGQGSERWCCLQDHGWGGQLLGSGEGKVTDGLEGICCRVFGNSWFSWSFQKTCGFLCNVFEIETYQREKIQIKW